MEMLKNLLDQNMQTYANTELSEDEYIKDGLIHCKNCNTPRQCRISPFGTEVIVRCICNCQAEKRDEEERIQQEIERQNKISRLKENSLLGARYKENTFEKTSSGHNDSFDNALARCKRYCDIANEALKNGYGIYIWGDKGTGKTHLTSCMAHELINKYKQVLFTNFFEISKSIRNTFNGKGNETDLINRIADVDFLFLDDLGTERVVATNGEDLWLQEKIFDVINKRYNNMKPTIFTSNYSLQELITDRGLMDKTVDRIAEMSTAILHIEGKSFRIANRSKETLF